MATKIRLARYGARSKPFYRIVVADHRLARNGRFLEVVGQYDPAQGMEKSRLKKDRIDWWLSKGAQASETVQSILRKVSA